MHLTDSELIMSNPNNWQYKVQVLRTSAASISLAASTIIALMIVLSTGRLSKPYRRLIFGLSISDIIQSIGIISSPFAQPPDTLGARWARGSISACEFSGFLMTSGTALIPMYTFALTLYFLLIVKYKMPVASFVRKVEWKLHVGIILWNLIGNSVAVAKDDFNARPTGLCNMTGYPIGCNIAPDVYGECSRGKDSGSDALILVNGPIMVCFAGIIFCLGSLTHHVYILESNLVPEFRGTNNEHRGRCTHTWTRIKKFLSVTSMNANSNYADENNGGQMNELQRQYTIAKESLTQSSLYVASYVASYLFMTVALLLHLSDASVPLWIVYALSVFWPLSGFFNILVYTRPKVRKLSEKYPEFNRFILFLVVIMSGGDSPPSDVMQAAVEQIARDADNEERSGDEDSGNDNQASLDEDGGEDPETNSIEGDPSESGSVREGDLGVGMSSELLLLSSAMAQQ